MDILNRHEIFEMEALEKLNSAKLLEPLVFGGGTMLRLCYELNRYSVDLDFWFVKKTPEKEYFEKLKERLARDYELTDAQIKYHTILLEMRSRNYPKRLKIEIRKGVKECEYEERIAFSKSSTTQVMLRVHTLAQMMKNKIEAAIERKEIRDCFDIEFMLRQGVELGAGPKELEKLKKLIESFKDNDYKVTLGALLEPATRQYYVKNKFEYLVKKIDSLLISE